MPWRRSRCSGLSLRFCGFAGNERIAMASYVDSNLMAGEKVVYRAHTSVWSLMPMILLGILLLIAIVGLFILIAAWIKYRTTEFAVTDRRVIAKTGLISRRTVEMFLDKV